MAVRRRALELRRGVDMHRLVYIRARLQLLSLQGPGEVREPYGRGSAAKERPGERTCEFCRWLLFVSSPSAFLLAPEALPASCRCERCSAARPERPGGAPGPAFSLASPGAPGPARSWPNGPEGPHASRSPALALPARSWRPWTSVNAALAPWVLSRSRAAAALVAGSCCVG